MRSRIGHRAIVIGAWALLAVAPGVTTADVFANGGSAVADRLVACTEPAGPVTLASLEQVRTLVVGTWIRCEGSPLFSQFGDAEVGVEVDADGRFYRLFEAADGTLLRADGLDLEGTWAVIDTTAMNGPGSYQMNWKVMGLTKLTTPTFFESPPSLRLGQATDFARYERWTGAAPVSGLPPGADRCGHPTGPISPASEEQFRDLLIGSWTLCGDASALGDPTGEVGLEITADGHLYRLVRNADGTIIRGVGSGQEFSWTVTDTTAMNGPGSYQVDLQVAGGGTMFLTAQFLESPPFVRFVGMNAGPRADYLRGEPLPRAMPATGSNGLAPLLILAALVTLLGVALRAVSRVGRSERIHTTVERGRRHRRLDGLVVRTLRECSHGRIRSRRQFRARRCVSLRPLPTRR